jgi:hypothetical protein
MARASIRIAVLPILFLSVSGTTANAQATAAPGSKSPSRGARQETVRQIVDRISQSARFRIVADSALSRQQLTAPEDAVTRDTLEDYLTRLARRLPAGTSWMKVYLPPATENRRFSPDAIAQLARAQTELLGRPTPNTVQIQGKVLSQAEADPIIRTLGLEPVYVLTNRQASAFPGGLGGGNSNAMMDALTKQLGVASVTEIPSGTYNVTVPGANGSPMQATVEVENVDGKRRISVRMGGAPDSQP